VSDLEIVFPAKRDVTAWASDHADGKVPDRWPYGLHHFERHVDELRAVNVRPPTRSDKFRVLQRLAGSAVLPGPRRDGATVSLAWDENTAVEMFAQRRASRMYSGLIWLTDIWGSGVQGVRAELLRCTLRRFAGLWCLSRPQVDEARRLLGKDMNVSYVPFGVDVNYFRPAPYPRRPMIFSAGGDRDRDPETLLEAFRLVREVRPDVELVVQSKSAGQVPEGVRRLDHVPHRELRDYYQRASVVVLATRPNWHASGMTVSLETQASGRPVVACATPGMEDYVREGVTGHLVPVRSPGALAARTLELLDAPDRAAEMGGEARAHVEGRHTTRHLVEALAEFVLRE
jgi:glycosyltransferase involved in cell wall biosynthesis